MHRGYRFLIVAAGLAATLIAFGLGSYITALIYPQEQRYQAYRYAADKPQEAETAPSGRANSQSFEYRTPCSKPKGRDESDLCAQWRAAQAAENSALWAKWGFWITIAGTFGLYWQIYYTRKAVEDTSEATDAMREANDIARGVQRAWIDIRVEPTLARKDIEDGWYFRVDVTSENIGQTVATHIVTRTQIICTDKWDNNHTLNSAFSAQVEDWRIRGRIAESHVLPPKAIDLNPYWTNVPGADLKKFDIIGKTPATKPYILVACIYRTSDRPTITQVTWRAWLICSVEDDGHVLPMLRLDREFAQDRLTAMAMMALIHYEVEGYLTSPRTADGDSRQHGQ